VSEKVRIFNVTESDARIFQGAVNGLFGLVLSTTRQCRGNRSFEKVSDFE